MSIITIVILVTILIVIMFCILLNVLIMKNEKQSEVLKSDGYTNSLEIVGKIKEEGKNEYTVSTSYGDVTFTADKYLQARGFAGSSNYIYYMLDNDLYLLRFEGNDEKLAEKVLDIYYESEKSDNIIVEVNKDSKLVNTNISYIKYVQKEKIKKINTSRGEIIITADKYLQARGFTGASNYIYYMLNGNLYLYNFDKEDELIAEKILDIYYESNKSDYIIVDINSESNVLRTDISYIKFVEK